MGNQLAHTDQDNVTHITSELTAWNQMRQQADVLVKSGFFPVKTAEQALAILMTGKELGFQPMQSMRLIDVIQGKVALNAGGMATLVQRYCQKHGGYLRQVALDNDRCTVEYMRAEWPEPQRFTFTMDDAEEAGLAGRDMWKKHPRNMLYARAISNACRMGWPEVIAGIYDPEELGAIEMEPRETSFHWTEPATAIEANHSATAIEISAAGPVDQETGEIIDTDRQRAMRRYHAIVNERGLTTDERKALQRIWPGVESSKDMTTEQIVKLTTSIERNSNEQLREKIAQNAPDRASDAEAPETTTYNTFDPVQAAEMFTRDIQNASTWAAAQAAARMATDIQVSTPELERAKADAYNKFHPKQETVIDVAKVL